MGFLDMADLCWGTSKLQESGAGLPHIFLVHPLTFLLYSGASTGSQDF